MMQAEKRYWACPVPDKHNGRNDRRYYPAEKG
jgi:hypothetical protein